MLIMTKIYLGKPFQIFAEARHSSWNSNDCQRVGFARVTLVGVIDADLPLRIEDFRASERAFQMLVQVSGRAGRGSRQGGLRSNLCSTVSIQFARKSDLQGFTEDELKMRQEFGYPPFRHLIRHLFKSN